MESLSGFRLCNVLQEILNACWLLVESVLSFYSCSTLLEGSYNLLKNGKVGGRGPRWGPVGSQRSAHEGKGDVQIGSCTVRPFAELETKIKAVFKKMPKCEIFDLSIFIIFLCHEVSIGRGLGGWNKKFIFLKLGPVTYHFIIASIWAVYAGNNFLLWVSTKKSCFRFLWSPLDCVKIAFLIFHFFHWLKLDIVKLAILACD